ncbi:phosphopantetheine-binding protein [Faecalimonas umbilicata]|uniref:phosphopantetheine-binding protein n=1 Tax=Faecalimonas umbilicata TaxID=1912855 RepID=UPI0022E634B0|nr:phosphopantetheine-binding protein [Faecalimonas umbilicata]
MKIYDFLLEKFIEMGFQEQELLGKEEFYELNLSSLEKVDLILAIQEKYGVTLELAELESMNIDTLEKYIL